MRRAASAWAVLRPRTSGSALGSGRPAMVTLSATLPVLLKPSVAVTVKPNVPAVVGLPLSRPAGDRVSPWGRTPEVTAKL